MGQKETRPVFVSGDGKSLSHTWGMSGVRMAQRFYSSGWEAWWRKVAFRGGLSVHVGG